jgi:hypothetical protein
VMGVTKVFEEMPQREVRLKNKTGNGRVEKMLVMLHLGFVDRFG